MYAIKNGPDYLRTFNPVSGMATWTRDVREARKWLSRTDAERHVEMGDKVVYIGHDY